ncbi:hypothetical protein B0O80DRAFT_297037 [Mortierella sp. GBAus27b]|nr:hypothetical protein B0O80DRAFT_297037 [Mortierella sp. GBAus27b]
MARSTRRRTETPRSALEVSYTRRGRLFSRFWSPLRLAASDDTQLLHLVRSPESPTPKFTVPAVENVNSHSSWCIFPLHSSVIKVVNLTHAVYIVQVIEVIEEVKEIVIRVEGKWVASVTVHSRIQGSGFNQGSGMLKKKDGSGVQNRSADRAAFLSPAPSPDFCAQFSECDWSCPWLHELAVHGNFLPSISTACEQTGPHRTPNPPY